MASPARASAMQPLIFILAAAALLLGMASWWDAASLPAEPAFESATFGEAAKTPAIATQARDALAAMPLRSDLWLTLAKVSLGLPAAPTDEKILEMAYLTGGGKTHEIAERLRIAVRSPVFSDPTIKDFVTTDITTILHRLPAQRAAIEAAYREAKPENRQGFFDLVTAADATFAKSMATGGTQGGVAP